MVIVFVAVAMSVIVVVRMSARFAWLENTCDSLERDRFTFEHLLHSEVVLHKDSFIGEGRFEMEVTHHPSYPGGLFLFAERNEEAGF